MVTYANLRIAKLDSSYLDTNATTHEFLFGAMAELIDNSRDAGAKCLKIYTENLPGITAGFSLNFLDDGQGMSPGTDILFNYFQPKKLFLFKLYNY